MNYPTDHGPNPSASGSPIVRAIGLQRIAEIAGAMEAVSRFMTANQPLPGGPEVVSHFLGTIVASGYSDERYSVQLSRPTLSLVSGDALAIEAETDIPIAQRTVTATNLIEAAAGTHLVADGTLVHVFSIIVNKPPASAVHWWFSATPITSSTITVITAVQWNETSGKLEYKSRTVRVASADAESAWTEYGTYCDHA